MNIDYDLVIAGGSIAGAALGIAAQRAGARVLIVEPERTFRDRVRGESLHPWGVAEAHRLGLAEVLAQASLRVVPYWDTYIGGERVDRREFAATTSSQRSGYNAHHPELQTALLAAARAAGADVRTGAKVVHIEPGSPARVALEQQDERSAVTARLAVVADGRSSPLRAQLGIAVTGVLMPMLTSGVLLAGVRGKGDATASFQTQAFGDLALVLRLTQERARLYLVGHGEAGAPASDPMGCVTEHADRTDPCSSQRRSFSGRSQLSALFQRCSELGVPSHWLAQARAIGPLATFETTCFSLRDPELPRGVVLIGDAAGNVDPAFGCGQSLALRDVRTLIEHWRGCADWQLAAASYIRERRCYHAALLRVEGWLSQILFTRSPGGDALRALTLPRLARLGVDLLGAGPDAPSDAATEAELFAGVEA